MTLVILVSLKTMETSRLAPEGVVTRSGITLLFSVRTVSLIDADA